MKRKHTGTGDEPNPKRTKTQGFFQAVYTMGQNINASLHDWLWGEQAQERPSENIPEEAIPLTADAPVFTVIDNQANTVEELDEEIDADLEEAIALSLMTDIEEEKAEEKPADKPVVPFGRQEKAQEIISDLHLLWKERFLSIKNTPSKYYNSKEDGLFRDKKIADYRLAIIAGFDRLNDSLNEAIFRQIFFKIASQMLLIEIIYRNNSSHMYLLVQSAKKMDALLAKHDLIQPIAKCMFEYHQGIIVKYKNILNNLESLRKENNNRFIAIVDQRRFNSFQELFPYLSTIAEEIKEHNGAVFLKGIKSLEKCYAFLSGSFTKPVLEDRNRFFETNFAFNRIKLSNGMRLPPEVTAQIILPVLNQESKMLSFSQADVTKLQDFMWNVKAEKESSKVKKLSPNNK